MAFYHSLGIKVSSRHDSALCICLQGWCRLDARFLGGLSCCLLTQKTGQSPLRFLEKKCPFSPFTSLLCKELYVNIHYTRFKLVNLPPVYFQTSLLMYSLSPFTTPINLASFSHSLHES